MGKWKRRWHLSSLLFVCVLFFGVTARAQDSDTIQSGIYAGDINLSGMSAQEAEQAIRAYVEGLRRVEIILLAAGDTEVAVTAGELGIAWANPGLVAEALEVGRRGNVIKRYKVRKDLENSKLVYPVRLSFDPQAISDVLLQKCLPYDTEAVNATLVRENGQFRVVEGSAGYTLDAGASTDRILQFLTKDWDHRACRIELAMAVEEPGGNPEALAQVQDVLGTYTTSYASSTANRCTNIENGCGKINGTLLYPGDEFSAYDMVGPFTAANGYQQAGSYLNGKIVDSYGGGICQVSTTLYNAVLLAELEVTRRCSHSMMVNYVEPSADAAIAGDAGKDLKFINCLEYPVYIEGSIADTNVTFTIYGKETRDAGRKVRYESVVVEKNVPSTDAIRADTSKPIGYFTADGAHIGYKAQLWKVVLEDGKEVARTQVNSSSYKMVPRSATVGTATDNPVIYEQIMAAINTGSIDHVKNVLAALQAQPAAAGE